MPQGGRTRDCASVTQPVPSFAGGLIENPLGLPTGPASGAEARGAERYTVLLRTAKLIAGGAEYLCVLRDISATGVKLRLFFSGVRISDRQFRQRVM